MTEGKQKKEPTSLRMPQPKKLGLAVPPLLRLPHEDLIQPQRTPDESSDAQESSAFPSPPDTEEKAVEISHAESTSLANLDPPKTSSLAKSHALGWQITSLATSASLANLAGLEGWFHETTSSDCRSPLRSALRERAGRAHPALQIVVGKRTAEVLHKSTETC